MLEYQYRHQQIEIEGSSFIFKVFDQFENTLDAFLDSLPPQSLDLTKDKVPLYGQIWPAAATLSSFIAQRHPAGLHGKRVLEIGCGLALPGMMAARLGACVTATDYLPEIGRLLDHNSELNHVPNIGYALCDFRELPDDAYRGGFDYILASEITYERQYFSILVDFLCMVASEGCVIYIADPLRTHHKELVDHITDSGHFSLSHVDHPTHGDTNGSFCRILCLKKLPSGVSGWDPNTPQ